MNKMCLNKSLGLVLTTALLYGTSAFAKQTSKTLVLACSDSKTIYSTLHSFVVRMPGGIFDSTGLAAVELALMQNQFNSVEVVADSKCESVKLAFRTPRGRSAGSAHLDRLLSAIRGEKGNYGSAQELARASAERTAERLFASFPTLKKAKDEKRLTLSITDRGSDKSDSPASRTAGQTLAKVPVSSAKPEGVAAKVEKDAEKKTEEYRQPANQGWKLRNEEKTFDYKGETK